MFFAASKVDVRQDSVKTTQPQPKLEALRPRGQEKGYSFHSSPDLSRRTTVCTQVSLSIYLLSAPT